MARQTSRPAATTAALLLGGAGALQAPPPADLLDIARHALRTAQVQLYCDHDADALAAVRVARAALANAHAGRMDIQLTVEEAAWHVRRHETDLALQSLERAHAALG